MLVDERTGTLNVGAVPTGGATACTILDGLIPGEFAGACGTAVHTKAMVIIDDTDTDPRWAPIREAARPLGIKSCWSIPIFSEGQRVLGTFAISHLRPCSPTQTDLQLLEMASHLASIGITRARALQSLLDSEARFRDLYESAPLAYVTSHMDGRIKSTNSRVVELLGYSQESLMGRLVVDLYAPGKNGREKAQMLNALTQQGNEIEAEELMMQRADGSCVWVSLTVRLIRDQTGKPIERRGIVEDITARKETEELLKRQKSILELVSTKGSLEEILTQICQMIESFRHQMFCSVHLLDGFELRLGAAPTSSGNLHTKSRENCHWTESGVMRHRRLSKRTYYCVGYCH